VEQCSLGSLGDRDDADPAHALAIEPVDRRRERLERHLADPGRLVFAAEPTQGHGERPMEGEQARTSHVNAAARAREDEHADRSVFVHADRRSLQARA
jgi:hypothetical protein